MMLTAAQIREYVRAETPFVVVDAEREEYVPFRCAGCAWEYAVKVAGLREEDVVDAGLAAQHDHSKGTA